jgi:hypothetical protein
LDPDEFTGFVEGEEYDWNAFSVEYRSNPRKKFFYQSVAVMEASTMAKIST